VTDGGLSALDIQSLADERGLAIDEVGIAGLRLPVRIMGETPQSTVAEIAMNVDLDPTLRGAHMSRFVEVLASNEEALDAHVLGRVAHELRRRLNSRRASVALTFPYFLERLAPVTGIASFMDYTCTLTAASATAMSSSMAIALPCSQSTSMST